MKLPAKGNWLLWSVLIISTIFNMMTNIEVSKKFFDFKLEIWQNTVFLIFTLIILALIFLLQKSEEKGFKIGKQKKLKDILGREDLLNSLLDELENLFEYFSNTDHQEFRVEIAENLTTLIKGLSKFLIDLLPEEKGKYELWTENVLSALKEYFNGILSTDSMSDSILRSEFSLYAKCVGAILISTENFLIKTKSANHITIRTILSSPISKWYNIAYMPDVDCYITGDWWEDHKKNVSRFANVQKKILIKRLIGVDFIDDNPDPLRIVIRKKNDKVAPIKLVEIIKL